MNVRRQPISFRLDSIIRARRELIEAGKEPSARRIAEFFKVSETTYRKFMSNKSGKP